MISEDALPDVDPSLCPKVQLCDYLGRVDVFPVVRGYFRCLYYTDYTGWTEAVRAPIKFATALVGNIPEVKDLVDVEGR